MVDTRRQVSGHAVVGLTAIGGQPNPKLRVYLPADLQAAGGDKLPLRVEIDSADGRYYGIGVFSGPVKGTGWRYIQLLPDDKLLTPPKGINPADLAISVHALLDGGRRSQPLLASWSEPELRGATLRLNINSRRASQLQIQGHSGSPRHACTRIDNASTLRFDAVCEIKVSELEPLAKGQHRLRLIRRDGFAIETSSVELWL